MYIRMYDFVRTVIAVNVFNHKCIICTSNVFKYFYIVSFVGDCDFEGTNDDCWNHHDQLPTSW